MEWTPEKAYAKLQEIYTDKVMQEEKRRVFDMLERRLRKMLNLMGLDKALEPYETKMKFYQEFVRIPGDSIFLSMQILFNIARGERPTDPEMVRMHLDRVYELLFTPAGLRTPQIPEMFWSTPLGVACQIAEKGVESVYPLLDEIENQ